MSLKRRVITHVGGGIGVAVLAYGVVYDHEPHIETAQYGIPIHGPNPAVASGTFQILGTGTFSGASTSVS